MRITMFDESAPDLVDRMDSAAINEAALRYRNADHGLRRQWLRRLQLEILQQLARQSTENP